MQGTNRSGEGGEEPAMRPRIWVSTKFPIFDLPEPLESPFVLRTAVMGVAILKRFVVDPFLV